MDKAELKAEFNEAMLRVYELSKEFDPFAETSILRLRKAGGVHTAKRLMAARGPQAGLIRLWEAGRLGDSVEALMLQEKFQGLFNEEELATARKRLDVLGYKFEDSE